MKEQTLDDEGPLVDALIWATRLGYRHGQMVMEPGIREPPHVVSVLLDEGARKVDYVTTGEGIMTYYARMRRLDSAIRLSWRAVHVAAVRHAYRVGWDSGRLVREAEIMTERGLRDSESSSR